MNKRSRRVCIALITDAHDNILMGKRNDSGKWAQPAGKAYVKEDPYYCMIRELKEETGLDVVDMKLIGSQWNKDKNLILYLFKITVEPNQLIDASGDPDKECPTWSYQNPNDVVTELHVPIEENIALKYWIDN